MGLMGSMGDIDTESYIPTSSELGGTASSPTSSPTSSPASSPTSASPSTGAYQAGATGGSVGSLSGNTQTVLSYGVGAFLVWFLFIRE